MSPQARILSSYEALDDLSEEVGASTLGTTAIQSRELALGPLAELLVLRRQWKSAGSEIRLETDDDRRYAAIRQVTGPSASPSWHVAGVGAFNIVGGGEAADLAGHEFAMTAGRLASEAGMPDAAARLWKGAFAELIGNVTEHAGGGARGIAIYEFQPNAMWIAVADNGQGVVRGYVSSGQGLGGLDAATALTWAVAEHRSRFSEPGRGTGFSTVMRAMMTLGATVRVRSDDASIEAEGDPSGVNWVVRDQDLLGGFVVSMYVAWKASLGG